MPPSSVEAKRITVPPAHSRGGHALWARSVLRLQQAVGNREVLRLMDIESRKAAEPAGDAGRPPEDER